MKKICFSAVIVFYFFITTSAWAQTCNLVPNSKKCVDSTPCKDMGGIYACLSNANIPQGAAKLPQSCWQYSYEYACEGSTTNTCSPYENNKACTIVSSRCIDTIPETGKCSMYSNTYNCITKQAVQEKQLSCNTGVFDSSGMTAPANTNGTFSKAALAAEMLREAGTYGKEGKNIFGGVYETCSKGYAGIKNCCKAKPGASSNSVVMGLALSAGGSAVKYAGGKAIDMASPYVFDAMFTGGEFTSGLAMSMGTTSSSAIVVDFATAQPVGTNFAAGGPTLSAYGFTFQSGVAASGSGFLGANTTLATFGQGQSMTSITFNPYVFGAMVAITVIQQLASCSQNEQMLALHRGANLSVYTNQWCSKSILGYCYEYTESYCSFNSVLARIINIQGKPQLGKSVNDCTGFSVDEISKIDFTKIDFSEFTGQMSQQAVKGLPTNMKDSYTPVMQNKTSGSAQGTNSVIPTYPK